MTPVTLDLADLWRGTSYDRTFQITDEAGDPLDLTGIEVRFRLTSRTTNLTKSTAGGSVFAGATLVSGLQVVGFPSAGEVRLVLSVAETRSLLAGRLTAYEIETKIGPVERVYIQGDIVAQGGENIDGQVSEEEVSVTEGIIAASRAATPQAVISLAVGAVHVREHRASPQGEVSDIRLAWVGWYYDGATTFAATNVGADAIINAYLEYPTGTFTAVRFGGQVAGTIPNGGQLFSDVVGTVRIAAGDKFWIHTINASAGSRNFGAIALPANANTLRVDDNLAASFTSATGLNSRGASTTFVGPAAVIGTVAKANARSFIIFGDSIAAFGVGDVTSAGPRGGSGYAARALDPYFPWMKVGQSGQAAANIVSDSKLDALLALFSVSDQVIAYGRNDLNRMSRTQAQFVADCQAIFNKKPAAQKHQSTITPGTTSTDTWATVANQTEVVLANSDLVSVNGAIRAGATGATKIWEVANLAMSAVDSKLYAAPDQSNILETMTLDGSHPTSYGAARLAAAALPALDLEIAEETYIILSYMSGSPTTTQIRALNALRVGLLASVNTSKFDGFYVYQAPSLQIALVNWFGSAGTLTVVGGVVFTPDVGVSFNGVDGETPTGFVPSAAPKNFAQASAHIGFFSLSKGSAANPRDAGVRLSGLHTTGLGARFDNFGGVKGMVARINDTTSIAAPSAPVPERTGHFMANRSAQTSRTLLRNGSAIISDSVAATGNTDTELSMGRYLNEYSSLTVTAFHFGAALSGTEINAITSLLNTYNAALNP